MLPAWEVQLRRQVRRGWYSAPSGVFPPLNRRSGAWLANSTFAYYYGFLASLALHGLNDMKMAKYWLLCPVCDIYLDGG